MSRSAEFSAGVNHLKTDDFVPAPTERRAGPLGPRTQEEQEYWDDEIRWSKTH